jgi:hypothetical protein
LTWLSVSWRIRSPPHRAAIGDLINEIKHFNSTFVLFVLS